MNEVDLLLSENKDFRFIGVFFSDKERVWTFKTLDNSIKVGDLILVPTENRGNKTIKVAEVVQEIPIDEMNVSQQIKWVVQRVDRTNYDKCLEVEVSVKERLRAVRASKLKKDLMQNLAEELGEDKLNDLRKETLITLEVDSV